MILSLEIHTESSSLRSTSILAESVQIIHQVT